MGLRVVTYWVNELTRDDGIGLTFYRREIAPWLPGEILDFHAHIWLNEHLRESVGDAAGSRYMVAQSHYPAENLLADAQQVFPGSSYSAVCFGTPTPLADPDKANGYAAKAGSNRLFPLLITGRDMIPRLELEKRVREEGFFGYKVFLNWHGDDYGNVTVSDMIGPEEMSLADELKLIVLLHVPGAGRLADPEVQRAVRELSEGYPGAAIVLAHCGRAYMPDEMSRSIEAVRDLENVYLDTAMVMDPTVLQIVFANVDSRRVLFATDFPIANMRGRRVYVMDHWVDVVLNGYPESAFRVASNGIRATFMAHEIVLAIKRAADMAGLSRAQLSAVFHENGMSVLRRVMDGGQMGRVVARSAAGNDFGHTRCPGRRRLFPRDR